MSARNFDISQAPRGHTVDDFVQTAKGVRKTTRFLPVKVILATKCGKVTVSKYMPDEDRWEMLQKGEQPIAWQLWPLHPDIQWFSLSQDTPSLPLVNCTCHDEASKRLCLKKNECTVIEAHSNSLPLKPQEAVKPAGTPPSAPAGTNSDEAQP